MIIIIMIMMIIMLIIITILILMLIISCPAGDTRPAAAAKSSSTFEIHNQVGKHCTKKPFGALRKIPSVFKKLLTQPPNFDTPRPSREVWYGQFSHLRFPMGLGIPPLKHQEAACVKHSEIQTLTAEIHTEKPLS